MIDLSLTVHQLALLRFLLAREEASLAQHVATLNKYEINPELYLADLEAVQELLHLIAYI